MLCHLGSGTELAEHLADVADRHCSGELLVGGILDDAERLFTLGQGLLEEVAALALDCHFTGGRKTFAERLHRVEQESHEAHVFGILSKVGQHPLEARAGLADLLPQRGTTLIEVLLERHADVADLDQLTADLGDVVADRFLGVAVLLDRSGFFLLLVGPKLGSAERSHSADDERDPEPPEEES